MNSMNKHNNTFRSVTYTFLYSIPNGIDINKKTPEEKKQQEEFINQRNRWLKKKYDTLNENTKIPRVKSMNFNEITL